MDSTARILIAEEDPATRQFLADNLTADGYEVFVAIDGHEALRTTKVRKPHLIIASVNGGTLELIGKVTGEVPIIVVGSYDELMRIRILDQGADDVVTKPFSYPELRARVSTVIRRTRQGARRILRYGDLEVDVAARVVMVGGEPVKMTRKSFDLLVILASDPSRVFTKDELMTQLWGTAETSARTLDSHACRLRATFNERGARFVVNVWGVGYRLADFAPDRSHEDVIA